VKKLEYSKRIELAMEVPEDCKKEEMKRTERMAAATE
jgi:hypothetical protein